MALNGHVGASKTEARQSERACFVEGWTHQALMAAVRDQDERYAQIEKLSDLQMGATFLTPEAQKLDQELEALQESLPEGSLVVQFSAALRRACQKAVEEEKNLYFFSEA